MRTLKREDGGVEMEESSADFQGGLLSPEIREAEARFNLPVEQAVHPRSLLGRRASSDAGGAAGGAAPDAAGRVERTRSHLQLPAGDKRDRLSTSSGNGEALLEAVTFVVAPLNTDQRATTKTTSIQAVEALEARLRPRSPGALPVKQKPSHLRLDLSQASTLLHRGPGMPSPFAKSPLSPTLLQEASQLDLAETTDEGLPNPLEGALGVGPTTSTPLRRRSSQELLSSSSEAVARRRQASPSRTALVMAPAEESGRRIPPAEGHGLSTASLPTSSKRVSVASSVESQGSQDSPTSKARPNNTGASPGAGRTLGRIPERRAPFEARGPHHGVPTVVANPAGADGNTVLPDELDDMDRLAVLMGITPTSKTSTAKSARELELDWDAVAAEGSDDEVEI